LKIKHGEEREREKYNQRNGRSGKINAKGRWMYVELTQRHRQERKKERKKERRKESRYKRKYDRCTTEEIPE
jgi:hypothetical protein